MMVAAVSDTGTRSLLVEAQGGRISMAAHLATRIRPFVNDTTIPETSPPPLTPIDQEDRRRAATPTSPVVASPLTPPSTDGPVEGFLQSSWPEWQNISQDRWVTDFCRGYELTFERQPPL